jgi:methionyl-tRNA formyltransferase
MPLGEVLHDVALAAGIPALESSDINARGAVRILSRHELDYIVCVGFDRLFSPQVLATARLGGLNAHPSLLPRWRGPSPLFWALKAGERQGGVTVHAMDERADHGVIYAQESFVMPHRASGDEIYRAASELAAGLILNVLSHARAGTLAGAPQDERLATRAPRPRAEDAYVEPSQWRAEHLVDFCCGATYFRAPWFRLGDEVYFARRGLLCEPGRRMPGHFALCGSTLVVACMDGLAHIEVQV